MEYLSTLFKRFFIRENESNLQFVGSYHHAPRTVPVNTTTVEAHQRVLRNAFNSYLYEHEIEFITSGLRRSDVSEEAILKDFFDGDVEPFDIVSDHHLVAGLNDLYLRFAPPRPALPVHLCDVEHHYPYKWNVNAEPPFATDAYFLDNRKLYGDFWDEESQTWSRYVNPVDMERRLGLQPKESLLATVTPAKFGFMKEQVFSWTRRWLHIVKNGFKETAGLSSLTYLKDRYIFPMLLHTKTAIVKKDDPDKMRTIWGCSKPWIIADTMLWWEYIAWMKLNPGSTPMLWGYETFTGGWFRLNAELHCGFIKKSFVTLDWKRFDKRAYFSLIAQIMTVARRFLDFTKGYSPTKDYPAYPDWDDNKASRLDNLYSWTLENLFHAPIVLPNKDMYSRKFAGIPSGLFITQLLDSWYNYVLLATLLHCMGYNPAHCIIKVQGDDSIIRLCVLLPPNVHEVFLLRLSELALNRFNAVVSVEKSEIRNRLDGCEVLSYRNNRGLPHRDEIAMLGQFYHTKAKNPTPEITMAQAIGFAYASCGNHRRVYMVLKDIWDFYERQGYRPNPAGLTLVFGDSPDRAGLPHQVDHFPTLDEIRQYFTSSEYRNVENESKTWPMSHFLNAPCTN